MPDTASPTFLQREVADRERLVEVYHGALDKFSSTETVLVTAQTAYRCNPVIKVFHQRLRAKGKTHKQTIIACIGKLISMMNAVVKTGKPFDAKIAAA